jgi:RND family efflux transporter MFP subunit
MVRVEQELTNLEARIRVVKEEYALAQAEVKREEALGVDGLATQQSLDQARRQLQAAERTLLEIENQYEVRQSERSRLENTVKVRRAEVELAKLDLARCELSAPFKGIVAERNVEPGELVRVGTSLFRFVDVSLVEIPIEIPSSEANAINRTDAVEICATQNPSQCWEGRIEAISPEIDPLNRTASVYVVVENPAEGNLPRLGQLVEARIKGASFPKVVSVPRRALIDGFAFVKRGSVAERRRPEVLRALGDHLLIREGLAPGDQLIVTNLEMLHDGVKVSTSEEISRSISGTLPSPANHNESN